MRSTRRILLFRKALSVGCQGSRRKGSFAMFFLVRLVTAYLPMLPCLEIAASLIPIQQ